MYIGKGNHVFNNIEIQALAVINVLKPVEITAAIIDIFKSSCQQYK